jgi:hypothetical protein
MVHRGEQIDLKNMEDPNLKLTKADKKVLAARCIGLSFCEMNDDEIQWSIDQIIFKGSVNYGVLVVESETMAQHLSEEIKILILEYGLSELTLEEILLALRINYSGHVYPSGNEMLQAELKGQFLSTKFLADVLKNYMAIRTIFTRTIENFIDGYN